MLFSLEFIEIVAIQSALYLQRHILAIAEITTKNINYFIIPYFVSNISHLFGRKSKPKQTEYMKSSYIDSTYSMKKGDARLLLGMMMRCKLFILHRYKTGRGNS